VFVWTKIHNTVSLQFRQVVFLELFSPPTFSASASKKGIAFIKDKSDSVHTLTNLICSRDGMFFFRVIHRSRVQLPGFNPQFFFSFVIQIWCPRIRLCVWPCTPRSRYGQKRCVPLSIKIWSLAELVRSLCLHPVDPEFDPRSGK
jgi:hypothetical protein